MLEKTDLVIIDCNIYAECYVNNVLRPVVVPCLDDNSRPHTARLTHAFHARHGMMLWPACSPDTNPIDH